MRLFGVILAGGMGSRLGGADKALMPLGGVPLLAHAMARLSPQVERLALSANGDPARFARFGLPVLADALPDHPGPLAGVLAGLDWAAEAGADAVVSVAVDTPFFPGDLAEQLAGGIGAAPVAVAASLGRRHPASGLWRVALRPELRLALATGVRRLGVFADGMGAAVVRCPVRRIDPFLNINTPDDLERADALCRAGG